MRLYHAITIQQTGDVTRQSGPMGLWTLAKFTITIICGCMPVIPKFIQTIGPKIYSSSKGKTSFGPLKGSKISGFSAKHRASGAVVPYEAQRYHRGKYDSLNEYDIGMVAGKYSTFSRVSENKKPLPSSLGGKAANEQQRALEEEKSQILGTTRIETRRDDLKRQEDFDWLNPK